MIKKNTNSKAVILQKLPVYLKTKRVLASADKLNKINNLQLPYSYAISFWVFLHPQPPNYNVAVNKYTSILNHSANPNVMYRMSDQSLVITKEIESYVGFSNKVIYKTDNFPLQRWNNIILNYANGTLDVFINKKLVASKINFAPQYTKGLPSITSGENNGISGGICNVTYYQDPISLSKIELIYDTLKDKSPPVI